MSRRKYCYLSQQPYYGLILKVMHIIDAVEQPEKGRTSIRPSVYLPIDRQQRRRPMGLLLSAERYSCRRAAGSTAPALSSKCGQSHTDSRRMRLNTGLLERIKSICAIHAHVKYERHADCREKCTGTTQHKICNT